MLIISLTEEERQFVLLAIAVLSLDRLGFEHFAREIAVKFQGEKMFDSFREMNTPDPEQCEHGAVFGEWCERCNKAMKVAIAENE